MHGLWHSETTLNKSCKVFKFNSWLCGAERIHVTSPFPDRMKDTTLILCITKESKFLLSSNLVLASELEHKSKSVYNVIDRF